MFQPTQRLVVACFVLGATFAPACAAEREDVRKAINLVTSVKMPFPENLARNRAKTERVWLEREGATVGCIKLEERRWCYEHIPPTGNRAEMLRIRNEPSRGVYIGALYYYIVDYDLDGIIDVGSTTKIEGEPRAPIAHVIEFFSIGTAIVPTSEDHTIEPPARIGRITVAVPGGPGPTISASTKLHRPTKSATVRFNGRR